MEKRQASSFYQHFDESERPTVDYFVGLFNQFLFKNEPILTDFLNPREQYIFREKETCAPSRSRFFSGKRNCEQTDLSHWHSITNPWKFEVGVKGYAGKRCSVAGEASF